MSHYKPQQNNQANKLNLTNRQNLIRSAQKNVNKQSTDRISKNTSQEKIQKNDEMSDYHDDDRKIKSLLNDNTETRSRQQLYKNVERKSSTVLQNSENSYVDSKKAKSFQDNKNGGSQGSSRQKSGQSRIVSAVKSKVSLSKQNEYDPNYDLKQNEANENYNTNQSINLNVKNLLESCNTDQEINTSIDLNLNNVDTKEMTPGLKQLKYQGLRKNNDYDIDENDDQDQETIQKMDELNLMRKSDTIKARNKPQSAYAGGRNKQRKTVNRKQSRCKLDSQSQIPNELLEAANVENGVDDMEGDNKTDCISIDDVTNDDNDGEDTVVINEDQTEKENNLDKVEVEIASSEPQSSSKKTKFLEPNKKLSNIYELGENDNDSVNRQREEQLHADEDSQEGKEEKQPEKKKGNSLDDVTPEELAKLREILGPNFTLNETKIEGPDELMPSHMAGKDDQYSMKNRLKKLQDREAHRVKINEEEFSKNTARGGQSGRKTHRGLNFENEEDDEQARIDRALQEDLENGYDPTELKESVDGWEFYKRKKVPQTMVKRYCQTLDQDYTRYKITVCCHLNHILDLYMNQRKPFMRTLAAHLERQQKSLLHRSQHQRYYGQADPWRMNSNNASVQCMNNAICSQCPEDNEMDEEEKNKIYNKKYGIMNPNLSNQLIAQSNYYKHMSEGFQYFKEEKEHHNSVYRDENTPSSRAIKRLYINFDKDIAHRMFGYRARFVEEQMTSYMGQGVPSSQGDQSHKPLQAKTKELIFGLQSKYVRMEDYHTKQTTVKMLDSDDENDQIEIEKNKKLIRMNQRAGPNYGNINPKVRKTNTILQWHFDKFDARPTSSEKSGGQSPIKRRFHHHGKRFASSTLRDSNNFVFRGRQPMPMSNSSIGQQDMNHVARLNSHEPQIANVKSMNPQLSSQTSQYIGQMNRSKINTHTVSPGQFQNFRAQNQSFMNSMPLTQNPEYQYSTQDAFPNKGDESGAQAGFVIPPNVKFNINIAGMSTFQANQPRNTGVIRQMNSQMNGMPSNIAPSMQTQQSLLQNPSQLTREKIEMQRAFLIEQLSKYPQAYNAYLMMSGLNMNQINQQTGQNQVQPEQRNLQQMNQTLPSSAGMQGNNMQQPSLQQTENTPKKLQVNSSQMNIMNQNQMLMQTPPRQIIQQQLAQNLALGVQTTEMDLEAPQSAGLNSVLGNQGQTPNVSVQFQNMLNSVQGAPGLGLQSNHTSGHSSPQKGNIQRNSSKLQFAHTSKGGNQWASGSNFQSNGELNTNHVINSASKTVASNFQNPQGMVNNSMGFVSSNKSNGSQRQSTHGGKKFSNVSGGGQKSLGGSYISRTDKKQNPNYQYQSFASLTSLDQILMQNFGTGGTSQKTSKQNLHPSQAVNKSNYQTGSAFVQNSATSGMISSKNNPTIKNTSYRMSQQDPQIQHQAGMRGVHGVHGGQVDIQKLILKNKAMENAIQMQNLQMQYIEQMQHMQQQQNNDANHIVNSQFINKNRVVQQNGINPRQNSSLLSGGNKNNTGRTLNSINSKSTHHGGSNTAGSNTESNTNSNGENQEGISPAAISVGQNFEAGSQMVMKSATVGASAEGGQAEPPMSQELGVPKQLLQTAMSPPSKPDVIPVGNSLPAQGQSAFSCYSNSKQPGVMFTQNQKGSKQMNLLS